MIIFNFLLYMKNPLTFYAKGFLLTKIFADYNSTLLEMISISSAEA